jgi:hypothetical protein
VDQALQMDFLLLLWLKEEASREECVEEERGHGDSAKYFYWYLTKLKHQYCSRCFMMVSSCPGFVEGENQQEQLCRRRYCWKQRPVRMVKFQFYFFRFPKFSEDPPAPPLRCAISLGLLRLNLMILL